MTDEQLQKLLRLKRHEQPPAGYFDGLLRDVRRRQRTDALSQPVWRIALERVQSFLFGRGFGELSYAGAAAALVVGGIIATRAFSPSATNEPVPTVAQNFSPKAPVIAPSVPPTQLASQRDTHPGGSAIVPRVAPDADEERLLDRPTRYIIETRPVTYDQPFQF